MSAQNDLLVSLIAVARAAGAGRSLGTMLEKVLEPARSVTGATGARQLLLDEGRRFTHGLFSEGDETLVVGPAEARVFLEGGLPELVDEVLATAGPAAEARRRAADAVTPGRAC